MVSLLPRLLQAPALESSLLLLLLVQPLAQLAGSGWSSEQESRNPAAAAPTSAAPTRWRFSSKIRALRWLRALASRQLPGGRPGVREPGGAGLPGPSAPPRDHSQPHPRGWGRQNPRAHTIISLRGQDGEPEARGRPAGQCWNQP